jgi:mannosyltransferase OCH1-like enzyme
MHLIKYVTIVGEITNKLYERIKKESGLNFSDTDDDELIMKRIIKAYINNEFKGEISPNQIGTDYRKLHFQVSLVVENEDQILPVLENILKDRLNPERQLSYYIQVSSEIQVPGAANCMNYW